MLSPNPLGNFSTKLAKKGILNRAGDSRKIFAGINSDIEDGVLDPEVDREIEESEE